MSNLYLSHFSREAPQSFLHRSSHFIVEMCTGIILRHSFWHLFWHSFWHAIWHLFWHSFRDYFWHLFWHSLRHGHCRPPTTEFWRSRLSSAHWDLELAVKVRQCPLWSGLQLRSSKRVGFWTHFHAICSISEPFISHVHAMCNICLNVRFHIPAPAQRYVSPSKKNVLP